MKYKLIHHSSITVFNALVQQHLDEGWRLRGETVISIKDTTWYYQAVVKPDWWDDLMRRARDEALTEF